MNGVIYGNLSVAQGIDLTSPELVSQSMNLTNIATRSWQGNASDEGPGDLLIPQHESVAGAVLGILIICVGAFGNVLVITAVVLSKSLFKASNVFVVSLAVCDLFQTVLVRPLYVHTYVARQWQFGPEVCLYALYASNLAILESILHVSAIALYRYIIIVHPKCARRCHSKWVVVSMLVVILTLPLIIILAPSASRLAQGPGVGKDVVFNPKIMFCGFIKHAEFSAAGVIKKAVFLCGAAGFLFFCYVRIYHVVRASGQSVTTQGTFTPTRLRREMTLFKTVIVVFCTFVASYLPLTVVYALDGSSALPYGVYVVCVMMLWTSSSVNWMVYGLMNKQYLQAYRYVLCGLTFQTNVQTTAENGSNASKLSQNASFRELQESQNQRANRKRSAGSTRDYVLSN